MPPTITDDQFAQFIQQIESVLVHENAHIKDYNPVTGEFPGGEGAANSAEQSFSPELPPDMQQKVSRELGILKKLSLDFSSNTSIKVRR